MLVLWFVVVEVFAIRRVPLTEVPLYMYMYRKVTPYVQLIKASLGFPTVFVYFSTPKIRTPH